MRTDLSSPHPRRSGWLHRLWLARRWYGADWYLVLLSGLLLLIFLFAALFPQIAPYSPTSEVGPALLAPGQIPADFVLAIKRGSGITSLADIGTAQDDVGIIRGSQASKALRDRQDELTAELRAKGQQVTIRPNIQRYDTIAEALAALAKGALKAVAAEPDVIAGVINRYEGLTTIPLRASTGQTFIMGTNQLGQDVFSRLIWGTRIALIVGLASSLVSLALGVPIGLISGFLGGKLDRFLSLIMDSLYAFPGLILAISIAAVLGPGIANIIVALAVLYIPTYYRIVRGQTLAMRQELYVEAARSLGASRLSILAQYIFPNIIPSIVVLFSVNVADAILTEAGLSFLGLGLPPDTPDWGIDLARGQQYIRQAWWLIVYPGVLVMLLVLAFSVLGESLSEILNPRLNRS
ncbi:MAG: ABC transporter permease [Anaerolineae bacterium]|nr:ABC transporter permease [Anaerolineae bacterium]